MMEITQSIFSEYKRMRLRFKNRKISGKSKLSGERAHFKMVCLFFKKKLTKKIRKYFKMNETQHTKFYEMQLSSA
jgi:hypothetical protein